MLPPTMAYFCEGGSRYMYRCWTPPVPGVWHPHVHSSCAHNMARGLLMRTMGSVPEATHTGKEMFASALRLVTRVVKGRTEPVEPWSFDQVISSYRERRMVSRYTEAKRSLFEDGFCEPRDARISAFVKGEKLSNNKVHKPRVIMGRTPRYNLELLSFLKPIEHVLYPAFRGWGNMFLTHTRLIGKGLNGEERASLLRRKMLCRPGIVAFEVDCVSFESHVARYQLRGEHRFYAQLCRDPRLRTLLGWQERCVGSSRSGVKFRVSDVRASGDPNTGLGNTVIMCCLVLASAAASGLRFDFLADGDNAVIFCLASDYERWHRELPLHFLEMGHELQVGPPAREFHDIVFGQSKPIYADGRWTMCREPFKVLSHGACSHQHYAEMRGGLSILRTVGYCEAVLCKGVPILQEYAHAILKATRGALVTQTASLDNYEYKRVLDKGISRESSKRGAISLQTRLIFESQWGVPVSEQYRLEEELAEGFRPFKTWEGIPVEDVGLGHLDAFGVPFNLVQAAWVDSLV